MRRRFGLMLGGVALALAGNAGAARAQGASQPIRIILTASPGANTDLTTRLIAKRITDLGGPQVVIENRTGGAGVVGAIAVKQAAPDGLTLFLADQGTFGVNVAMKRDLAYDPVADFKPVTVLWSFPSVVAVPASLPVKSVAELIAYARGLPNGLSYGSQGPQSGGHVLGVMFGKATGAPLVHVPYRGAAPAITDLVAGRVSLMFASYSSVKQHVENGLLRVLAACSDKRIAALPDVPTLAELGYRDVELETWFGVVAPAATPETIVNRLNAQFSQAARSPEIVRQMADRGVDIVTTTPAEFSSLIKKDIATLTPILQDEAAKER